MHKTDFWVGIFVLAGIIAIAVLAIRIGGGEFFGNDSYRLKARFTEIGGLNVGGNVEIAGVRVGTVKAITLDPEGFYALVDMQIESRYSLDDDTMASIRTKGIIGDKYVSLLPGGSGTRMKPGDLIVDTESAVDLEGLISKFAFGSLDKDDASSESKNNETLDLDPLAP